ncbi:MAG: SDR family NAD(P)-dependent oxidoreductase [Hyphomonadaceae bacterium]
MAGDLTRALVVTGASSGIGRAVVEKAAAEGAAVFASVRNPADGAALQAAFGARVTPLVFDVADEAAVRAGAAQVARALGAGRLVGVGNNAGIAVAGPLLHLPAEDLARQLDINLLGVHRVTQAFAPLLGADPARAGAGGRIVMMSSVAGRFAQPFFGPYSASKFALEAYSDTLRRELMLYGVDVIVIGPGAIHTPIWDKAEKMDFTRYDSTPYKTALGAVRAMALRLGRNGLPAHAVAACVWRALTVKRPRTRYCVMRNSLAGDFLPRHLPPRWVDRIAARAVGLMRK